MSDSRCGMLSRWKSTWWHLLPSHSGCFSGEKAAAAAAAAAGWPKTPARLRHVDNKTKRLDSGNGGMVAVVVVFNSLKNRLSSGERPSMNPFGSTDSCLAFGESGGLCPLVFY